MGKQKGLIAQAGMLISWIGMMRAGSSSTAVAFTSLRTVPVVIAPVTAVAAITPITVSVPVAVGIGSTGSMILMSRLISVLSVLRLPVLRLSVLGKC